MPSCGARLCCTAACNRRPLRHFRLASSATGGASAEMPVTNLSTSGNCNLFLKIFNYILSKQTLYGITPYSRLLLYGGEKGIRTLVSLTSNGFQDRRVMTTSLSLRIGKDYIIIFFCVCQLQFFGRFYLLIAGFYSIITA